jgi:hypothetical protein
LLPSPGIDALKGFGAADRQVTNRQKVDRLRIQRPNKVDNSPLFLVRRPAPGPALPSLCLLCVAARRDTT